MRRIAPLALLGSLCVLSWMLMQLVHELGHVAGAALAGGAVERVVWHPLSISRTDLSENPAPLLIAWAGPLVGVGLPLAAWGVAAMTNSSVTALLRFFAGFCLIANGAYLGIGSFLRIGDCETLLAHGAPIGTLWLFGAAAVPLGLLLWHRLGPDLGWGPQARQVPASRVIVVAGAAVLVIALGFLFGGESPN